MKAEVFITGGGILLFLFLFLANQTDGMLIIGLGLIIYNSYCAYYYKGKKNFYFSIIPVGIFLFYILSSGNKTLANIMLFVWFGSMIYFAMNVENLKKIEPEVKTNVPSKYCFACGSKMDSSSNFCPSCGKEQ